MKKLLIMFLIVTLFSFTGCDEININSLISNDDSGSVSSVGTASTDNTDNTVSEPSSTSESANTSFDSDSTVSSFNSNSNDNSNNNNDVPINSNIQSSSSVNNLSSTESITSEINDNKETPKNDDAILDIIPDNSSEQENLQYYLYEVNGTLIDSVYSGDIIYTIFSNPNYLLVVNAETGENAVNKSLGGRPAEIYISDNEIWISFPDLKQIKIFDKDTLDEKQKLYFEHEISSFDLYNDYIIYAENDQWVSVYRHNLATGESKELEKTIDGSEFFQADILVNKDSGLFYVSECGSTGSKIYCYDIETLKLKSYFKKDDYGYMNHNRKSFFIDSKVYWADFCFDGNDLNNLDGQFGSSHYSGMIFANEELVVTMHGIYMRSDYSQIAGFNYTSSIKSFIITDSGHISIVEDDLMFLFQNK